MRPLGWWRLFVAALLAFVLGIAAPAHAFCGFYVATGDGPVFNDASRVVLLRAGLRTVMSIQNDYQGPPEGFALVVPVPVVLERANVRTLPLGVIDRIDRLTSPRLVEYWEQDPCAVTIDDDKEGGTGVRAKGEEGSAGKSARALVKVEAEFSVDEYDIVILSTLDSGALDTWLKTNGYKIPDGAEPYLRPYVEDGSKFFVAKVDPKRVHFRWGRAALSPLRFHYDAPAFSLPTRLGLINSAGSQDLIVYVLGATRYDTANYENLTIPTNLVVKDPVRGEMNAFYASLYDRTVSGHPHAVVTEYAWRSNGCDPCPEGGPLTPEDTALLGGDVVTSAPDSWVLTRLHARYGKASAGEDLVFKAAPPIVGGRGDPGDQLSQGPEPANIDAFQARYIIRHPWTGPLQCTNPSFGVWGGQPYGETKPPPPARSSPLARRDLDLSAVIVDPSSEPRRVSGPVTGTARVSAAINSFLAREDDRALVAALGTLFALLLVPFFGWRAKRGYFATGGLFAFTLATTLGLAIFTTQSFDRRRIMAHVLLDLVPLAAAVIAVAIMCLLRADPKARSEGRRAVIVLAALLPLLGGLYIGWSGARFAEEAISGAVLDFDLAARIAAESLAETLEPIVLGSLRTGVLLLVACLFVRPAREGQRKPVWDALAAGAGALVVALAARVGLRGHFALLDVAVLLAFLAVLFVVNDAFARRGGRRTVLVLTASFVGFAFVSLAAFQNGIGTAMSSLSGESIEPTARAFVATAAVQEERIRLLLLVVDLLLLSMFAVLRARTASAQVNGANVGASLVLFFGLAAACLAPAWTGQLRGIRSLGASLARFSGTPMTPSVHANASELDGPALIVDRANTLFATPGSGVMPVPFAPPLFEELARASADVASSPLLLAPPEISLRTLLGAIAPMLDQRQSEFRLLSNVGQKDAFLGPWLPLVLVNSLHPHAVELEPVFALAEGELSSAAKRCTGFLFDGVSLRLIPLQHDGDAYLLGGFDLDGELVTGEGIAQTVASKILAVNATGLAAIIVGPETSFDAVDHAASAVAALGGPRPVFSRIVVSPGRATIENALKPR